MYHNTFTESPNTVLQISVSGGHVSKNIDIWNNIFALTPSGGPAGRLLYNIQTAEKLTFDSDYNVFWDSGSTAPNDDAWFKEAGYNNNQVMTLAQWQDLTPHDDDRAAPLGSTFADPLFVTNPTANDYFTQLGSPVRDAGLRLANDPVPCGVNPDAGFLESCN